MTGMKVKDLIERLGDYGDHLEVVVGLNEKTVPIYAVTDLNTPDGPVVVLDAD